MSEATTNHDILDLYLAFLQREADFVRRELGYDQLDGLYTPVRGRVNLLYGMDINAGLQQRSRQILAQLEV